jgi:outer membrane protein assembly factor BamB
VLGRLPVVIRLLILLCAVAACLCSCAGGDEPAVAPTTAPVETTEEAEAAPPPPNLAVHVVDGDTGEPVPGARVEVREATFQTTRDGVAAFAAPPHRISIHVARKGYSPTSERLDFRGRTRQRIEVWRPALQWPLYGANPARTQVQPNIKVRPPFRIVWKRDIGGLMEFPATTWEGVAYVHTIGGKLRAILMKNGRVLWTKREGNLVASAPAVDPQRGLLVSTSMQPGYVTVRSLKTGKVRWRYYTGLTEPSPVIRGGVAYFGATNGNVYALDLDKRKPRWVFHGGVKITSSPALVGNRLYFGDYAGRVFALSSRTGRVVWRGSAGSRVYGTVAVAGGRVFAPSVFSGLSALSARTGRLLWRLPVSGYLYSSPAVFRGRVYFGTYGWSVFCVSASSGRVLWRRAVHGAVSGAVGVVDKVVYASTLRNETTAFGWRNGRTVWKFADGKYVPVSGSGERLLIHGERRIYAVEERRRQG